MIVARAAPRKSSALESEQNLCKRLLCTQAMLDWSLPYLFRSMPKTTHTSEASKRKYYALHGQQDENYKKFRQPNA
jgi:hypothetical protein